MARPTLTDRVNLFVGSEMAGKTDRADLAKALKAAASKLNADDKPATTAADSTASGGTAGADATKPGADKK